MSQKDYLRIGKISSFNYPKGTARITYEDRNSSTTVEMPFIDGSVPRQRSGTRSLWPTFPTGPAPPSS